MFIIDLLFVFVITLILTGIFGIGFKKHGWGSALMVFFFILLLGTWAGGVWIPPFGPALWGVAWLAYFVYGIFIAILLTAIFPDEKTYTSYYRKQSEDASKGALITFNLFFWILMIGLGISILISYI